MDIKNVLKCHDTTYNLDVASTRGPLLVFKRSIILTKYKRKTKSSIHKHQTYKYQATSFKNHAHIKYGVCKSIG